MALVCTPSTKWRLVPGIELLWRSWSDESVVFNTGSGDCYLLNLIEAETLRSIERSDWAFAELSEQVAGALDAGDLKLELEQYLEKLLTQFQEVGLVEQVSL